MTTEVISAREEVERARQAFRMCNCGVCHGRLVLARKQLATLELNEGLAREKHNG